MKYRTKLFVYLILLVVISNTFLFILMIKDANDLIKNAVGSKALSIAATLAKNINGDEYQQLTPNTPYDSPLYRKIEHLLRSVRDANRRDDVYVKYIYSLLPYDKRAGYFVFGVDAEEDGPDKTRIGTVMTYRYLGSQKQQFLTRIDINQILPHFIQDAWGVWLTGISPINNSTGKVVGAIRVDLRANDIVEKRMMTLLTGIGLLSVSVLFAMFIALLLTRHFSKPLQRITTGLKAIEQGDYLTQVDIKSKNEFGEVADIINYIAIGLQQRDTLKTSLARYVSKQVVDSIIASGETPVLKGERRKISVLFCDVRDFTSMAEKLSPEEVVSLLNEIFEAVVDAIFQNQGILDKFLGDGFMALFGALSDDYYQEEHAIQAALDIQTKLQKLNQEWDAKRNINIHMGIGINTGIAVVGNVGSTQHMEYTAIGDTVNLASRLESATKELGVNITISEYTYVAVRGRFHFQQLGSVTVKGRTDPVTVYTVGEKRDSVKIGEQ